MIDSTVIKPAAKDLLVDALILQAVMIDKGVPSDQTNNYISCLRVIEIERELDLWIERLKKVDDIHREELARNLATLVLAPDSENTKEKCLKALAGPVFGYRSKTDREAANAVHAILNHSKVKDECMRIRSSVNITKLLGRPSIEVAKNG